MPPGTDDGAIVSACFGVAIGIGFVIVKWSRMVAICLLHRRFMFVFVGRELTSYRVEDMLGKYQFLNSCSIFESREGATAFFAGDFLLTMACTVICL